MGRQFTPNLAAYTSLFFLLACSAATLAQNPQEGATAARDATRNRGRITAQRHAPPTAFASLNKPVSFSPIVIYYSRDGAEVPTRKAPGVEKRTAAIGESITILYGGNKSSTSQLPKPVSRSGNTLLAKNTTKPSPLNSPLSRSQSNVIRPLGTSADPGRAAYTAPAIKTPAVTPPVDSALTDPKPSETEMAVITEAPIGKSVNDDASKIVANAGSESKSAEPVSPNVVTLPNPPVVNEPVSTANPSPAATVAPAQNSSTESKLSAETVPLNSPVKEAEPAIPVPAAAKTNEPEIKTAVAPPTTSTTTEAKLAPETTSPPITAPGSVTKPTTELAPPPVTTSVTTTRPATDNVVSPPPDPAAETKPATDSTATSALATKAIAVLPPVTETKVPIEAAAADPVAMNNTAIELTRESRFDEASDLLRRAIQVQPDTYKLHRNLSIVYERMNKLDDALKSAQTAVELAPDEPSALTQLCSVQVQITKYADALHCYENLRKLAPLDPVAETSYAVAMLRSGKTRNAIALLEKTAARAPVDSQTLNALGVAYFDGKRFADAVSVFKKAVELDPDQHGLRFNLAIAYLSNGNKEGALSQYRLLKEEDAKLAEQLYLILFRDKIVSIDELRHK